MSNPLIVSVVTAVVIFSSPLLSTAACPPADLTGDCVVDFADLRVFTQQWLADGANPADLVGNEHVDLADLAELARYWGPRVVINEIHYHPDVKTELVEFIELYNTGPGDVDISGWYFSNGISYTFPQGTILPELGYIIVAQDPNHIHAKWSSGRFGIPPYLVFGPWQGKLKNDGERIVLRNAKGQKIDQVDYKLGFPWPTVGDPVPETAVGNGPSIQLINPFIDNDLGGSWRSALPTPAAANSSVYMQNPPPHIRQLKHSPKQPKSNQPVTITAKITDDDGIAAVRLLYQIVEPGNYFSMVDPQYSSGWAPLEMHDDGRNGDLVAGDDIYTVQIPPSVQVHRRLIRYRILAQDTQNMYTLAPYTDDPQPNFAYFVYDGVPPWRGADRPGVTPVIEYSPEVLQQVPVYHLISKKEDIEACTWLEQHGLSDPQRKDFKWYGTFVYDGEVYDHIRYRARGGVWRHAMGKNMWKFDFNRGHYFQARDDYGKKYDTKWDKLNFSACIQQGSFGQRGEQGMFEALTFKLFNMTGVPAPKTHWVHFRIIDEPYEDGTLNAAHPPMTTSGTQYDGDFWGLYLVIEQPDGRFLDEHDLPDGNLYKMSGGTGESNNQGPTQPSDGSDLVEFLASYQSKPPLQWWGSNVNLECYYSYYAVYHACHHGDITHKNHFFYHNPELTTNEWGTNSLWWQLPWDVDLTWTTYYGSMSDPFSRSGIFNHDLIRIRCRNRTREICDLLFNPEQMNQLIDEMAAIINDPNGGLSITDADRAMWDYHWVMSDQAYYAGYLSHQASFKAGQGRFYEEAEQRGYSRTFDGMVQVMKDFVVERTSHMNSICADSDIPATPVIKATCPPTFPINALTFETSNFSDPQGSYTFAAMKWRIAEVAPGSVISQPSEGILLIQAGEQWKYFKGTQEPSSTTGAWRQPFFDDADWLQGDLPIGYGENFIVTTLGDMRGKYTTVYLRKSFEVSEADLQAIDKLILEIKYDDGYNLWINGAHLAQANVSSDELPYSATTNSAIENKEFVRKELPDPASYLVPGTNVIAIQLLNASLSNSSDCFLDVRLTGHTETEPPVTPPAYKRKPGKYEIDAVWESDEITTFTKSIRIPPANLKVGRTYRVRCRMKDNTGRWSHWSAPIQFVAGEPIAANILQDLRITELMFNPPPPQAGPYDNDDFEFIELKNIGDEPLDLTGVSFVNGITFNFANSDLTTLQPDQFVLLVRNKAAFESRYGTDLSDRIAGQYSGKLDNNGERITLADTWNGVIADFEYSDGRLWPQAADGAGHSLVPLDHALALQPQGSLTQPTSWRASTYIGGSPGRDDPTPPQSLLINELMAHTDYFSYEHPEYDSNDWIELYNPTDATINLRHWYLSDDKNDLKKWPIPAIDLPPHGIIYFDEVTGFHSPITTGFGLNKAGEQLYLSYLPGTAEDRVVDAVRFKGQENAFSLGRYPDGGSYWFTMPPSPRLPNNTPTADILINELMYHPVDSNDEYIELYNPTSTIIQLENDAGRWKLKGAVDYTFPAGLSIPAGGRLVVVGFDPAVETSRLAAFITAYGTGPLTPGLDIVGPWSGNLSNAAERLSLECPQAPDNIGDPVCWVVVDELAYSDISPWPEQADGQGLALQRRDANPAHSSIDPTTWQAHTPTPGSAP